MKALFQLENFWKDHKTKLLTQITTVAFTITLSLFAASCGKTDTAADSAGAGQTESGTSVTEGAIVDLSNENYYKAEYTDLSGKLGDGYSSIYVSNDRLMDVEAYYEEGATVNGNKLVVRDYATLEEIWAVDSTELVKGFDETYLETVKNGYCSTAINAFNLSDDGMDVVLTCYTYDSEYTTQSAKLFFVRLDMDGNYVLGYEAKGLYESLSQQIPNLYFSDAKKAADGCWVISTDDILLVLDESGNLKSKIDLGNWPESLLRLSDGRVYVKYYNSNRNGAVVTEVDTGKGALGQELGNLPMNTNGYALCQDKEDLILFYSSDGIYLYDMKNQTSRKELSWVNCDIMGSNVRYVNWLGEDHYAVILQDWNAGVSELADLVKVDAAEASTKQQVNIAVLSQDSDLESAVVAFNKSQDKYHAKLVVYYDYESGIEYDTALTNLQNSVLGDNAPDLIGLEGLDVANYAKKNVFADLKPFIQGSSKLQLEDYFDNIIASGTYEGKLVTIPYSFSLMTYAVNAKDFSKDGWTIDEAISYDEAHPNASLCEYPSRSEMYQMLLAQNMDYFANTQTGECHFDSDEFKRILTYLSGFASEYDWDNAGSDSSPTKIRRGELLAVSAYLSTLEDVQVYQAMFDNQAKFIGYPTYDGTPKSMIYSYGQGYGIYEKGNKEGAWAFLEYYLSRPLSENIYCYGFPSNKQDLQKMIDTELENGKAGGNSGGGMSYGDWEYNYHYATQEEIDCLIKIMESAALMNNLDQEIMQIIEEEAEPFYAKQKSVDEVASVIQSRVSIYLAERM